MGERSGYTLTTTSKQHSASKQQKAASISTKQRGENAINEPGLSPSIDRGERGQIRSETNLTTELLDRVRLL